MNNIHIINTIVLNKTENKLKIRKLSKNMLTYKEMSDIMKSQTKKSKNKRKREEENDRKKKSEKINEKEGGPTGT